MAHITLRPNHLSKTIHGLGLFVLLTLVQKAGATQFKVGDSYGWTVTTDPKAYSQWAEKNRFQIGDSLLFVYLPDKDSVLQVNMNNYGNCSTESPIASFNDGYTSFTFYQSGPYYFISGNRENCLKNEKMAVIVLADRSNRTSTPPPETNPSTPPPPPPSAASSPPEITPATSPVVEETPNPPPPPNGVSSSMAVSFMGSLGLLGSSLLLVL